MYLIQLNAVDGHDEAPCLGKNLNPLSIILFGLCVFNVVNVVNDVNYINNDTQTKLDSRNGVDFCAQKWAAATVWFACGCMFAMKQR